MALSDFEPERYTLMHKGSPLTKVRGLSLIDVSRLVRGNLDEVATLFGLVKGGGGNYFARLNEDGFLLGLITQLPDLAATIISLAADEEDGFDGARRLTMPLQMLALRHITRLTFEDVGGPLAFARLIEDMLGRNLLPKMATAQQ